MRRRLLLIGFFFAAVLGVLAVASAPQILRAARLTISARAHLEAAEFEIQAGRNDAARAALDAASQDARGARRRLRSVAPFVLGKLPLVGRPVRSAEFLVTAAADASSVALAALAVFPERSPWSEGGVDLRALKAMDEAAVRAQTGLEAAARLARRAPAWPLPDSLGRARRALIGRLDEQLATVSSTRSVLEMLPAAFGDGGRRRYFVVFQNPAEMRGTGGFWGNYAFLDATAGRVALGGFGRLTEELSHLTTQRGPAWYEARYGGFEGSYDWRQMNFAPDFPAVAKIAEANLKVAPGLGPVDGVIAVDSLGLAALLKLTGPVTVADWPEPISAENVVRITLHDAYSRFDRDQLRRTTFFADVAQATWSALLRTSVPVRPDTLRGLGDAVKARRMIFHFVRRHEQRLMASVDADGALGDSRHTFALVTQNTAPSKLDYWLERRLHLKLRLDDDGSADVRARMTLYNGTRSVGEPDYVTGPASGEFKAGWEQQFVSLYVPKRAVDAAGRADVPVGDLEELGFKTASTFVDIAPLERRAATAHFTVPSLWDTKRKELSLRFRRQPALHPDAVGLDVVAPKGWKVVGSPGVTVRAGRAVWRGQLDRDVVIVMKLARNGQ